MPPRPISRHDAVGADATAAPLVEHLRRPRRTAARRVHDARRSSATSSDATCSTRSGSSPGRCSSSKRSRASPCSARAAANRSCSRCQRSGSIVSRDAGVPLGGWPRRARGAARRARRSSRGSPSRRRCSAPPPSHPGSTRRRSGIRRPAPAARRAVRAGRAPRSARSDRRAAARPRRLSSSSVSIVRAATALGRAAAHRMIDQHVAHRARGDGEEVRAAAPVDALDRHQLEKRLVHQVGRGERVRVALAPQSRRAMRRSSPYTRGSSCSSAAASPAACACRSAVISVLARSGLAGPSSTDAYYRHGGCDFRRAHSDLQFKRFCPEKNSSASGDPSGGTVAERSVKRWSGVSVSALVLAAALVPARAQQPPAAAAPQAPPAAGRGGGA